LLATATQGTFHQLSAVTSGVKELARCSTRLDRLNASGQKALLFVDEIYGI
jgi:replication-associated recombination protein RarA